MVESGSAKFHNITQGLLGLLGAVALVTGGWLYFMERRGQPRVVLQPTATVLGISRQNGRDREEPFEEVLVQVSISIENRSSRRSLFNCAAIDLIGISGFEEQVPNYPDDLDGVSVLRRPAQDGLWRNCRIFERRRRETQDGLLRFLLPAQRWINPPLPSPETDTGARYRDFMMEPGEITTKSWEQRVSCRFSAVRLIFKLPNPRDADNIQDYEAKILIPIAQICRNERSVSMLRLEGAKSPAEVVGAIDPGGGAAETPRPDNGL